MRDKICSIFVEQYSLSLCVSEVVPDLNWLGRITSQNRSSNLPALKFSSLVSGSPDLLRVEDESRRCQQAAANF